MNREPATSQQNPYRQRHHCPKMCKCLLNCGVNDEKTVNLILQSWNNPTWDQCGSICTSASLCLVCAITTEWNIHYAVIAAVPVGKKTAMISTTHDISKNTFLRQQFHLPSPPTPTHPPWWPILFRTPVTPHTPAYPPHENQHFFQSSAHLCLIGLSVFSSLARLVLRELISPCQPPPSITQQPHTHTRTGLQVTPSVPQGCWYWCKWSSKSQKQS